MRNSGLPTIAAALIAATASAQDEPEPLSVIDWLAPPEQADASAPGAPGIFGTEPDPDPYPDPYPESESGDDLGNAATPPRDAPVVEVAPLAGPREPIGLLPESESGIGPSIWAGSDPETISRLVRVTVAEASPAMRDLQLRLLLARTRSPAGPAGESLDLARLDKLLDFGAVRQAFALAELAGAREKPEFFARWMEAALILGTEAAPCRALEKRPRLTAEPSIACFCAAARGDRDAAIVILETGAALDQISPSEADLLRTYLAAAAAALPAAPGSLPPSVGTVTPLQARLRREVGVPLPTAAMPRRFAHADLGDLVGWKSRLHAAERLARSGALDSARLLEIYLDRQPSASGGVWDRVAAVQALDLALFSGRSGEIGNALEVAWKRMETAGLAPEFARMFGRRLAAVEFEDPRVTSLAWKVGLLDDAVRAPPRRPPDRSRESRFLEAVASGRRRVRPPADRQAEAIASGLARRPALPSRADEALKAGRIGEALLLGIAATDRGARGDPGELATGLAILVAAGFPDTARQAALEARLLSPTAAFADRAAVPEGTTDP